MATDYSTTLGRSQPSRSAREIPESVAREIIADAVEGSAALQLGSVMRMPAYQHRIRVLSALAEAKWLEGTTDARGGTGDGSTQAKDSAVKQRTKVEWDNVFITPEELAVMVVVPDGWMDDSDVAWAEIRKEIGRAFSKAIDEAVFFGVASNGGLPSTFGPGVVPAAVSAGNVVNVGSGEAEGNATNGDGAAVQDLGLDIATLGELLDGAGYDLSGFASYRSFRWRLRRLRGIDGQPLLQERDGRSFLYGENLREVGNGSWDADQAVLLAGEWDKLKIGVRQDITFKVFDQATLTDGDSTVTYSAAEQDGKVLRAVMRLGYATPNPVKVLGGQFPFAVLQESS